MSNERTRTALVTGAGRGIGLECANRLRGEGYRVISVDLSVGSDPAAGHEYHPVDVSDSGAVQELAARVGTVDVLVNSAGIVGPNMPTVEVTDSDWERTLAVNLNGTFFLSRAFAPGMVEQGWGRIVNIASIAGKEGNPNLAAYSASKAAVIAFTKSLGKELATTGVLVNSIAPAVIATPMNDETAPHVLEYMISKIPMGRTGTSAEVAALVAWLASDECSFSTGACYDISGGRATY